MSLIPLAIICMENVQSPFWMRLALSFSKRNDWRYVITCTTYLQTNSPRYRSCGISSIFATS